MNKQNKGVKMSTKAKRASKIAGKTMGMIVFAILFAFNIQVAFSDDASEELNFLGVKISLFNDITGKPVQADDDDGGGGGGGSGTKKNQINSCIIVDIYGHSQTGTKIICVAGGAGCYYDRECQ